MNQVNNVIHIDLHVERFLTTCRYYFAYGLRLNTGHFLCTLRVAPEVNLPLDTAWLQYYFKLLESKAFCDEITLFVCIQIMAYTTFECLQGIELIWIFFMLRPEVHH